MASDSPASQAEDKSIGKNNWMAVTGHLPCAAMAHHMDQISKLAEARFKIIQLWDASKLGSYLTVSEFKESTQTGASCWPTLPELTRSLLSLDILTKRMVGMGALSRQHGCFVSVSEWGS